MKLYKIIADTRANGGDTLNIFYVGTQADAASKRKDLTAEGFARKEITTEDVDVPTDKAGLLAFLNAGA